MHIRVTPTVSLFDSSLEGNRNVSGLNIEVACGGITSKSVPQFAVLQRNHDVDFSMAMESTIPEMERGRRLRHSIRHGMHTDASARARAHAWKVAMLK